MNKNEKLDKLKDNYKNIEIPRRLDSIVNDAINSNLRKNKKSTAAKWSVVAASIGIVVGAVNLNPGHVYSFTFGRRKRVYGVGYVCSDGI